MFQHVTELLVLDAAVRCTIVLDDLLDLGGRQLRLLADGEDNGAVELVLSDDPAAQTVVVLEVLNAAHAVLVDRDTDLVKDLLQRQIHVRLQHENNDPCLERVRRVSHVSAAYCGLAFRLPSMHAPHGE